MPARKKVSDDALVSAYAALGTLDAVSDHVGLNRTSVHERLTKLGVMRPMNVFSDAERDRLRREYLIYRDAGKLGQLAASMGRTKPFLARQARDLGLTDKTAPRTYLRVWKGMTLDTAEVIWEDFKASSYGLGQYCKSRGFDDLGFARTMKEHFGDEWDHVIELKQPKQGLYRLGRAFEYRVRDALRTAGYFVLRSPASKSPVDLVAIRTGEVLFIQCKRGGSIGVTEWNSVFDLAVSVGAIPILAETSGGRNAMRLWRMTDRKDGTKRPQPMAPFVWDTAAAA